MKKPSLIVSIIIPVFNGEKYITFVVGLISHKLWIIEKYCDRVAWMDSGEIKQIGKAATIIKEYQRCSGK